MFTNRSSHPQALSRDYQTCSVTSNYFYLIYRNPLGNNVQLATFQIDEVEAAYLTIQNTTIAVSGYTFYATEGLSPGRHTLRITITRATSDSPFLLDYIVFGSANHTGTQTDVSSTLLGIPTSTWTPSDSTSTSVRSPDTFPPTPTQRSVTISPLTTVLASARPVQSSHFPFVPIIGAVVGGIMMIILACLAVLSYYCFKRHRGPNNPVTPPFDTAKPVQTSQTGAPQPLPVQVESSDPRPNTPTSRSPMLNQISHPYPLAEGTPPDPTIQPILRLGGLELQPQSAPEWVPLQQRLHASSTAPEVGMQAIYMVPTLQPYWPDSGTPAREGESPGPYAPVLYQVLPQGEPAGASGPSVRPQYMVSLTNVPLLASGYPNTDSVHCIPVASSGVVGQDQRSPISVPRPGQSSVTQERTQAGWERSTDKGRRMLGGTGRYDGKESTLTSVDRPPAGDESHSSESDHETPPPSYAP
ncbi:hypothetical protein ONZ51_g4382 [Trametes cubensis]|uniref:Uncharacterized protein n=1 Tax=Trametes cubensis TaxID=1111947 RepID=A0AAD7TVY1_9APHY|nr:hypothetical protein ONZ51_g4382 [Trametes cubensis]